MTTMPKTMTTMMTMTEDTIPASVGWVCVLDVTFDENLRAEPLFQADSTDHRQSRTEDLSGSDSESALRLRLGP
jgi:hypothetical protein